MPKYRAVLDVEARGTQSYLVTASTPEEAVEKLR